MVKKTLNPLINIDTFHDDIDIKISNISNFNYINQINEILEFYENFKENQTFSKTTQRKLHGIYYTNFKIALNITKETIQHVKKIFMKVIF